MIEEKIKTTDMQGYYRVYIAREMSSSPIPENKRPKHETDLAKLLWLDLEIDEFLLTNNPILNLDASRYFPGKTIANLTFSNFCQDKEKKTGQEGVIFCITGNDLERIHTVLRGLNDFYTLKLRDYEAMIDIPPIDELKYR